LLLNAPEGRAVGESQLANRWRAQGALTGARKWLLRLLQSKYPGAPSTEVKQLVEQQTGRALLNQWFEAALAAATFEQFVQTLK
jgi:hypothetical protein